MRTLMMALVVLALAGCGEEKPRLVKRDVMHADCYSGGQLVWSGDYVVRIWGMRHELPSGQFIQLPSELCIHRATGRTVIEDQWPTS